MKHRHNYRTLGIFLAAFLTTSAFSQEPAQALRHAPDKQTRKHSEPNTNRLTMGWEEYSSLSEEDRDLAKKIFEWLHNVKKIAPYTAADRVRSYFNASPPIIDEYKFDLLKLIIDMLQDHTLGSERNDRSHFRSLATPEDALKWAEKWVLSEEISRPEEVYVLHAGTMWAHDNNSHVLRYMDNLVGRGLVAKFTDVEIEKHKGKHINSVKALYEHRILKDKAAKGVATPSDKNRISQIESFAILDRQTISDWFDDFFVDYHIIVSQEVDKEPERFQYASPEWKRKYLIKNFRTWFAPVIVESLAKKYPHLLAAPVSTLDSLIDFFHLLDEGDFTGEEKNKIFESAVSQMTPTREDLELFKEGLDLVDEWMPFGADKMRKLILNNPLRFMGNRGHRSIVQTIEANYQKKLTDLEQQKQFFWEHFRGASEEGYEYYDHPDMPQWIEQQKKYKEEHSQFLKRYSQWREAAKKHTHTHWLRFEPWISPTELPSCRRLAVASVYEHGYLPGTRVAETKAAIEKICTPEVLAQQELLRNAIKNAHSAQHLSAGIEELTKDYSSFVADVNRLLTKFSLERPECNESDVAMATCVLQLGNYRAKARKLLRLARSWNGDFIEIQDPLRRRGFESFNNHIKTMQKSIKEIEQGLSNAILAVPSTYELNAAAIASHASTNGISNPLDDNDSSKEEPKITSLLNSGISFLNYGYLAGGTTRLEYRSSPSSQIDVDYKWKDLQSLPRKNLASYEGIRQEVSQQFPIFTEQMNGQIPKIATETSKNLEQYATMISNEITKSLDSSHVRLPPVRLALDRIQSKPIQEPRFSGLPVPEEIANLKKYLGGTKPHSSMETRRLAATHVTKLASDIAYANGNEITGRTYRDLSIALSQAKDSVATGAELAWDISPAGAVQDALRAITGYDIHDNKLSDTERKFAAASAITFGVLAKTEIGAKALLKIGKIFHGPASKSEIDQLETTFDLAKEIAGSSRPIKAFNLLDPGPLSEVIKQKFPISSTFHASSYVMSETVKPIKLYRVYGGNASEHSGFWSRIKPEGPYQAAYDSALKPEWKNSGEKWIEITIPPGTIIYEGKAASQVLDGGFLMGHGNQVYIPVEKIQLDKWPTKRGTFPKPDVKTK